MRFGQATPLQLEMHFGQPASLDAESRDPPAASSEETQRTDPLPRARGSARHILRGIWIVLALAGGILLFARDRGSGQLVPLAANELARLSPLLESGALARGPDSCLVGRIPPTRWFLMSRSERKSAASALRNHLIGRKITAAMVFRDDDVLAIQIEEGRVLAVE